MSYILDALNKSEQERQHQRLPNLKTSHVPITSHSSSRSLVVLLVTLLIVLLTAGTVFGLWYLNQGTHTRIDTISIQDQAASPVTSNPTRSADRPTVPEVPGFAADTTPALRTNKMDTDVVTGETDEITTELHQASSAIQPGDEVIMPQTIPANIQVSELDSGSVPDIVDLPLSIQKKIPALIFSTHIYASEPAWRMVGINGKSRRQGDTISDSLRLLEITEDGVVLEYDHYIFRMSVLRNWSGR